MKQSEMLDEISERTKREIANPAKSPPTSTSTKGNSGNEAPVRGVVTRI